MSVNEIKRILIWGMSENIGGIETFIMEVYRNIDREKVQFDFLCAHDSPKIAFEDEIIHMGGRVFRVMYSERESFFKARTCLKKLFKENKDIQAVHVHANFPYAFPLKCAKKAGIKLRILHSHNSSEIENETNQLKRFISHIRRRQIEKQIEKYPTQYLACSDIAGKFMFFDKEFQWIKNGINIKNFAFNESIRQEYRKKMKIDDDTVVVGFIGRYREQKNPLYLIDIFSQYNKLNSNSILLMIGIGEMQEDIDKKISLLGLEDKVVQLGKREDTNNLYQVMDAFLLPSIYEGLPVVLVEAQTAGLKCFVSDTITRQIQITELIHYYSIEDCPEQWAKCINEEMQQYQRRDHSEEVALAGFDMADVAKELERIYLSV